MTGLTPWGRTKGPRVHAGKGDEVDWASTSGDKSKTPAVENKRRIEWLKIEWLKAAELRSIVEINGDGQENRPKLTLRAKARNVFSYRRRRHESGAFQP
jgi:hypothetical protein